MNTLHLDAVDHAPDDGAPRYRSPNATRTRFALATAGTLVLAGGIVLAVSELLPTFPGWALPVVLTLLTVLFLTLGRSAARTGATTGARAWAGWAGATAAFAVFGLVNLAGFGGALVAVLLIVVTANAGIALWFRSPVHWVVVQGIGIVWAAIAHVYDTPPWALLVLGLAGLWWLTRVGAARTVVVATTITIPVAVTLLVHPVTHVSPALDGADVAVLTGAVAVALTCLAVVGSRRSISTVWSTARSTALVVLVVQVIAGAFPAVEGFLAPAAPWPSELLAIAAVLSAAAVVTLRRTRPGIVTVLVLCALQLGETAAALTVGAAAATTVGLAGVFALAAAALVRNPPGAAPRPLPWLAVLVAPAVWAALVGLPVLVIAALLVVVGASVAVLLSRGGRR